MTTDATLTSKGQMTIPKAKQQPWHEGRRPHDLHADAGWHCRFAGEEQTRVQSGRNLHKKGRKAVPVELLSR